MLCVESGAVLPGPLVASSYFVRIRSQGVGRLLQLMITYNHADVYIVSAAVASWSRVSASCPTVELDSSGQNGFCDGPHPYLF